MRLSLYQYDIHWENVEVNLYKIEQAAQSLVGTTDLLVLPEMATTGFSMSPEKYAETMKGKTVERLQSLSDKTGIAIVGSFTICEGAYYNRAMLFSPYERIQHYDKKHLFRMGTETEHYCAGNNAPNLFHYKGWNIRVLICYDLRFPVWSRNVNNEYDLLIYTANWPKLRAQAWNTLLPARAIENISYVCGVNRIGKDGNDLDHEGSSQLIDYKGNIIYRNGENESIETIDLNIESLRSFRTNFPAWMDADQFELK